MKLKFYLKGTTVPVEMDLGAADCVEISGISAQLSDSGQEIPLRINVNTDNVVVDVDVNSYLGLGPTGHVTDAGNAANVEESVVWRTLAVHTFDDDLADFDCEHTEANQ